MLRKLKESLTPGGTLLILDIFQKANRIEWLLDLIAIPVSLLLRLYKTGKLRESKAVRAAWKEHGKRDSYLTISQVKRVCGSVLPGAKVRRHLLWRYSIIWRKPADDLGG